MTKETIKKYEERVIELDEKICDERRKLRNKSWGGSVFALNQWVEERERLMKLLKEAV